MNKKKFAVLATTGVLATSLAVGGVTYAMFTGSATNSNNTFTAGTIKISSSRDDTPMTGPMFYTESPSNITGIGGIPTGVWAPGDQNTRGLFLYNTGNLDSKLTNISALPVAPVLDSNGNATSFATVSSGAQYDMDMKFASKAKVLIWNVAKYDPAQDKWYLPDTDLTPAQINSTMASLNRAYSRYLANPLNRNATGADLTEEAQTLEGDLETGAHEDFNNAQFLQEINQLKQSISLDDDYLVTAVKTVNLSDLVGNGVSPDVLVKLPRNGTALLAYTINFDSSAGNDYQGISPYFSFGTVWSQTRNN